MYRRTIHSITITTASIHGYDPENNYNNMVKSGIFGQTAKLGQPPCLFHSSVIGMKNKLSKQ